MSYENGEHIAVNRFEKEKGKAESLSWMINRALGQVPDLVGALG